MRRTKRTRVPSRNPLIIPKGKTKAHLVINLGMQTNRKERKEKIKKAAHSKGRVRSTRMAGVETIIALKNYRVARKIIDTKEKRKKDIVAPIRLVRIRTEEKVKKTKSTAAAIQKKTTVGEEIKAAALKRKKISTKKGKVKKRRGIEIAHQATVNIGNEIIDLNHQSMSISFFFINSVF